MECALPWRLLRSSCPRRGRRRRANTALEGRGSGRRSSRCSVSEAADGSRRTKTFRPGSRMRPTSTIAVPASSMCSKTRHATAASNDASMNGSALALPRRYTGPPPRAIPVASWLEIGSRPTTIVAPAAAARASCPSPVPISSTRLWPARCSAASGRICSSYSASAPSVKLSCHHVALASQRSNPMKMFEH